MAGARRQSRGRLLALALVAGVGLVGWSLLPRGRNKVAPAELARLAAALETRYGVDRNLILAVVENESGGDANAVSDAGAVGLMQLLPATGRELADRHRLKNDLRDPAANMALGTAYLRDLGDTFGDQPDLVIAAYHAGPGRVQGWRKAEPGLSVRAMLEKYAGPQTKAYVANVKAAWLRNRANSDVAER